VAAFAATAATLLAGPAPDAAPAASTGTTGAAEAEAKPPAGLAGVPAAETIARGRAVFDAAGGCTCHTDFERQGPPLAGGRPLHTPFGIYYSPNITPDSDTGIGRWSDADFLRAMRQGVRPDGRSYFPVFPYTSFTGMTDADVLALKAYLFSLAPVRRPSRPPDAWPPFGWRIAADAWRWLFFSPHRFEPDPGRSDAWNRGAYLVNAVAHCPECHAPRNLAGVLQRGLGMRGSENGPEGQLAPNITPDRATGLGDWTRTDLVYYLQTGIDPKGDTAQGLMKEVIEHGYEAVPEADLEAVAEYVQSLAPVRNRLTRKKR
jgi:mono/diheme cytochrome c family protein